MDIARLRTLTTSRLHTSIEDVYKDIEYLIGEKGIMTHEIPAALNALRPWLQKMVPEESFWSGEFIPDVKGTYDIEPMTTAAREEFWKLFDRESGKVRDAIADNDSLLGHN